MAIGLSNVKGRKAKRTPDAIDSSARSNTRDGHHPFVSQEAPLKTGGEAWSTRGLAREGRSARRERALSTDFNPLWLDWTACVAGTETSSRILQTVRRILDLEMFVFEFLVYELEIPMRAKKRILGIRSKSARALQLRKLLMSGQFV